MTSPLQQKIRIAGPSVVTANRTRDGVVIYRTRESGWTTLLAAAAIVDNEKDARALWAEAIADDLGAVGSYIAPVTVGDDGGVAPGNLRETIRQRGVTFDLPLTV